MAALKLLLKKTSQSLVLICILYSVALVFLTNPWLQRHVLYLHSIHTAWWNDVNLPEQFGFAKNQITPFNFTTSDNELLYAWHITPIQVYAENEVDLLRDPSGCADDISKTRAFKLLRDDPDSRLVISFHGNAGSVAQGWRTDSYRSLSNSNIHVLAIDYRGFGLSSGLPTEDGLIIDGVAAVNWALQVARIPSSRIVLLGHSLGTAVTTAVAEHFSIHGTELAGVVLVSGFTNLPTLLSNYAIAGWVPILSPLNSFPVLQNYFSDSVVDSWNSARRLANYVRTSRRVRLYIIHSKDDYEIPWRHSEGLFALATNASLDEDLHTNRLESKDVTDTIEMGNGAFIKTWKSADGDKVIREEIVSSGNHNRIITYAPVTLAVLRAFSS